MFTRVRHENNPRLQPGTGMQDIPIDAKKRGPSSRLLQELIRQVPAEYITVGWLISHRHSFGIAMLCLGLLATTPVGSRPGGILYPMLLPRVAFSARLAGKVVLLREVLKLRWQALPRRYVSEALFSNTMRVIPTTI